MKRKPFRDVIAENDILTVLASIAACKMQTEQEKQQIWFESKKTFVSTVFAADTEKWETAVAFKPQGKWCIVKQYENKQQAEIGHQEWCKKADFLHHVKDHECDDIIVR